jgi:catechol 2,3-dioxygenase-like lactoylglutathione lyase family enzyme
MGTAASMGPTVLFVTDLERSKRFLLRHLDVQVLFEDENSAGLQVGGDMLMLLDPDAAKDLLVGGAAGSPKGRAPMGVFNLFVDDVDAWFARLTDAGRGQFSSNPRTARGAVAPRTSATPTASCGRSRRRSSSPSTPCGPMGFVEFNDVALRPRDL